MRIVTVQMHMRFSKTVLYLAASAVAGACLAACGGGGGGSATPAIQPTPTPVPVQCSIARQTGFANPALVPLRAKPMNAVMLTYQPGPGPAVRVCPDASPGRARCMAWRRTDVRQVRPGIVGGYSPSQLQTAYSLTAASSANGAGQVVAVVDAYDDPKAESDLGVYRMNFGLPACTTTNGCFKKVNENGQGSPLPATDPTGGWEGEESLDLAMVSAICPNCSIVLVEANTPNTNDLYVAEDTAAAGCKANVISNSWSTTEYAGENLDETHFNHAGVMITVSAGDNGYAGQTGYPGTSQYVTSVGGTSMPQVTGPQTVWSGTGSLCSTFIAQPSWQTALGSAFTSICSKRIENDVSAVADPNTGVAVYDSFGGSQGCPGNGWCIFGGTSVSAPIIGAVYGLAGNGASIQAASHIYANTTGNLTAIVSGNNGTCGGTFLCKATAGNKYNAPTGLGTPIGIGAF